MGDLIIDAGCLKMAINVLRRAGKDEVADQLEADCKCSPDELNALQQRNAELERERDELAAHVERYDKAASAAIFIMPSGEAKADLRDVYDESPQTSLAERYAEVVENFIDNEIRSACLASGWGTESSAYQVSIMLEQYANQLRNEDKE